MRLGCTSAGARGLSPAMQRDRPGSLDAGQPDHMTFELLPEGRLLAAGLITTGTAQAFAEELAKHGSDVNTVVLGFGAEVP